MPIPADIKRLWYGYDWQTVIRPRELGRADHRCERCRRPWKPLDVCHLDGNPANREWPNLAVLCRTCHRANDYTLWARRCRETRARKKDAQRPILVHLEDFLRRGIQAQLAVDRAIEGGEPC